MASTALMVLNCAVDCWARSCRILLNSFAIANAPAWPASCSIAVTSSGVRSFLR